jgi:hypothetical protein
MLTLVSGKAPVSARKMPKVIPSQVLMDTKVTFLFSIKDMTPVGFSMIDKTTPH